MAIQQLPPIAMLEKPQAEAAAQDNSLKLRDLAIWHGTCGSGPDAFAGGEQKERDTMQSSIVKAALTAAALVGTTLGAAAADAVVIGYQTTIDPAKVAQADGLYEKEFGRDVDWRKFDSGAEVIAAIAGDSLDIGFVGSSPLAVAASNKLPIETFFIADLIGDAEQLVVRNGSGIEKPEDLAGKTVAVPFVSTTHYSLLAALKHWGIDPSTVKIVNARPPEIAAAWERGDIDAAYVWDPALGAIKASGKVLASSAEVGQWGAPTFDAWIVRKDFAAENPAIVTGFARVTGAAYADYLADPAKWLADKANIDKVANLTGAKPEDVPVVLAGYVFPTLAEQASAAYLGGDTIKAVIATAEFLKDQGKIPEVLADYGPYVNPAYVKEAAATN
jgi:taurine transport system substrate-binding protein